MSASVFLWFNLVLLQRGADPSIRNTDGKTALDLADPLSKSVLTGTSMLLYSTISKIRDVTELFKSSSVERGFEITNLCGCKYGCECYQKL